MYKNTLSIVFTIDNGYTKQLAVTLYSLLTNKEVSTKYSFYVMHYGLTTDNQRYLSDLVVKYDQQCLITFLAISDEDYAAIPNFSEIPRGGHWGKEINFRILLPKYLPDCDRVLYLDTDIIVLRDLSHLIDLPIDNIVMTGVVDMAYMIEPWFSPSLRVLRLAEFNGDNLEQTFHLLREYHYVNSGVLLLSLDNWRTLDIMSQALNLMHAIYEQEKPIHFSADDTRPGLNLGQDCRLFPDQDILNYLAIKHRALGYLPNNHNLASTFFPLSGEANHSLNEPNITLLQWMLRLYADSPAPLHSWQLDKPYIIHFVGKKPWKEFAPGVNELYVQYAKSIGWHITYDKVPLSHQHRIKLFIKRLIRGLTPYALINKREKAKREKAKRYRLAYYRKN